MSNSDNDNNTFWGCLKIIGAIAALITILGFFGIKQFSSLMHISPQPLSSPEQTVAAFCRELANNTDTSDELTPRYKNFLQTLPKIHDPYTSCSYGSFAESSTSQGVTYYYSAITFFHRSGNRMSGTIDLIQDSNGNWKIDSISCGPYYC